MAGRMYLGNQMVTPVIVSGNEENSLFKLENGKLTKSYPDENGYWEISGIKEVGPYGLYFAMASKGYMNEPAKTVLFKDLEKIDAYGLYNCLYTQVFLEKVSFPKLKEVGERGFDTAFRGDGLVSPCYFDFSSLEKIGINAFWTAFYDLYLDFLIFPSLKEEYFSEDIGQFDYMLSDAYSEDHIAVYFPSSFSSLIGDWDSVTSGFGKYGTEVVFWIPTQIDVTFVQEGASIISSYKTYNSKLLVAGTSANYIAKSSDNKMILIRDTGLEENGHLEKTIDFTDYTFNKITLNVNISNDSELSVKWDNINIPVMKESAGVYSFYVNQSVGENIIVSVAPASSHSGGDFTITTTGEDITETIPVRNYTWFTRPDLTENGGIGGSDFAVTADEDTANAYKAVDSSTSTYWAGPDGSTYTIYNPKPLCIMALALTYSSSSYRPYRISVKIGDNQIMYYDAPASGRQLILLDPDGDGIIDVNVHTAKEYKITVYDRNTRVTNIQIYAWEDTEYEE